ncbi:MAG: sulfotransferase [Desulfovermiculus sp.]|nr:sulfotransferase [Desulfovermiculus sp.]
MKIEVAQYKANRIVSLSYNLTNKFDIIAKIQRKISIQLRGPKRCSLVVLGHQKSGTTAIAALAAHAADVEYSNDPLYHADWGKGELADKLLSHEVNLRSEVKKRPKLFCGIVVKDPDFSFIPDQVVAVFNRALIIYVVRDPRQTIRSIADRLNLSAEDLGRAVLPKNVPNKHWRLILEGQMPQVGGHSITERLAYRWKAALNSCRQVQKVSIIIRYEDFLDNKVALINNLVNMCGLVVRTNIDQDVNKKYQPPGNLKIDPFERLGHENVRVIEAITGEHMFALGYESWL